MKGKRKSRELKLAPFSFHELHQHGVGTLAFITRMSNARAKELFPSAKEIPCKGDIFCLYAADGTPLMISDQRLNVEGTARSQELEVIYLQ
jgi:hypothetical protein